MVQRHVTVMHVEPIPIWIIGVTVYVMMDMLAHIVLPIILMYSQLLIATTHVTEVVMDLKCMTV